MSDVLVSMDSKCTLSADAYRLQMPGGNAWVVDDGETIQVSREAASHNVRAFALTLTHDEAAVLAEALTELTAEPESPRQPSC